MIRAVIFDFGGVLAEEGFREGLKAVAVENRLDPDKFFSLAEELIYETGYVLGMSGESYYLDALREKTGVKLSNKELREEILKRFVLRPAMLDCVKRIKASGLIAAILSDQTNWLDELNEKTPFFRYFDYVFNSFHLKKGKRDSSIFRDACSKLGLMPDEVIFVDDNIKNIQRASSEGLKTIHFKSVGDFEREFEAYLNLKV